MLKRNFVKAGFFGHGALFILASPNNVQLHAAATPTANQVTTVSDSLLQKHTDSTVLYAAAPKVQWNASAVRYIKGFLKKNDEDLQAAQKRSAAYFRIIESVFAQYSLPSELKYLAVVESQLKTSALSGAGARGPWQLMSSTAREMGLKVSGKTDERTHTYKSTIAAAKYLKALYNEYEDWLLVIAAYNSGSGMVQKAIKKAGTRNFWALQRFLPMETREHVKRFIGTHYFFQQDGSITILTKSEARSHERAVQDYLLRQAFSKAKDDSIIATIQ